MTETNVLTRTEALEFLSFRVGGQDYAVDISLIREIRGWTDPSSLPDWPDFVLGVINLRGVVLPLLDLAARLGLSAEQQTERNVIIVAEIEQNQIGLMVESVSDIITLTCEDMQPPPEVTTDSGKSSVKALTFVGEKTMRILDLASILPAFGIDPDQFDTKLAHI